MFKLLIHDMHREIHRHIKHNYDFVFNNAFVTWYKYIHTSSVELFQ